MIYSLGVDLIGGGAGQIGFSVQNYGFLHLSGHLKLFIGSAQMISLFCWQFKTQTGPKPFSAFNIWLKDGALKNMLEEKLKECQADEKLDVQQKLQREREEIRIWNKNQNVNIFSRLVEVESELDRAEHENQDQSRIQILKMEIEELSTIEDSMLKQKGRINWIKE